jgi:zinc transport system substrate-binding protein
MPERETDFQDRFEFLEDDLTALDGRLEEVTKIGPGRPLAASHPVYQYLARRFDLNLAYVHFEPDEFPDERSWQELEALLADHPAKWMLWEAEPLPETRARLGELGVASAVFAPCGSRPAAGDYLSVMETNLTNLKPVFAAGGP